MKGPILGEKNKVMTGPIESHFYLVMKWCCVFRGRQGEECVTFGLHVKHLHRLLSCQHGNCAFPTEVFSYFLQASRCWGLGQHSPLWRKRLHTNGGPHLQTLPLHPSHTSSRTEAISPTHQRITTICLRNQSPSICVPKILISLLT